MEAIDGKTNNKVADQCYFLRIEGDLKFEDLDSMDNVTRKEFLVRLRDVLRSLEESYKTLKRIQKESSATIAILSSPELMLHQHARMELWGTAGQVEIAESAIVREITKSYMNYPGKSVPTILKQAPIYHHEVYIPTSQYIRFSGYLDSKITLKMEAESGAWLLSDQPGRPSILHLFVRRLKIFGTREEVYKALTIVNEAMLEPYKPAADDMVLDHQLPIDSNDFKKEQTVKVGNTEVVDYATMNDDELQNNEYDTFLKKIQSFEPMKLEYKKKKSWYENIQKWHTPPTYHPNSPAYIHDDEPEVVVSLPSNPLDASSYNCSTRPTPPIYRPTSPAYMFTSNPFFPIPPSEIYRPSKPFDQIWSDIRISAPTSNKRQNPENT